MYPISLQRTVVKGSRLWGSQQTPRECQPVRFPGANLLASLHSDVCVMYLLGVLAMLIFKKYSNIKI